MELDVLKLHTTWNDAAGSLNTNFSKIKMAIASLQEGSGGLNEDELRDFLVENGYATQDDIDDAISKLLGGAPEALDTLKEIADALAEDDNVAAGIINEVDAVKSQVALHTTEIASLGAKNTEQDTAIGQIRQKDEEQDVSLISLDDRLKLVEVIKEWFGKDEDGIYTDFNFRTSGELSAGGAGTESEEGGGGTSTGDYKMYHHSQGTAAKEWRVEHGLGKFPNVRVLDSNKMLCYGDVKYINDSVLTITFGAAEKGDAYCD